MKRPLDQEVVFLWRMGRRGEADRLKDQVAVLGEDGSVVNVELENTCTSDVAPEESAAAQPTKP